MSSTIRAKNVADAVRQICAQIGTDQAEAIENALRGGKRETHGFTVEIEEDDASTRRAVDRAIAESNAPPVPSKKWDPRDV